MLQLCCASEAYQIAQSALVLALQFDRVLAAVSRPFWGTISDQIGREHAPGLAFGLQPVLLLVWSQLLEYSWTFVVRACIHMHTVGLELLCL